ncbi:MAG: 3-dehydroquinate synthase [Alphaproteobacteria bacterium]
MTETRTVRVDLGPRGYDIHVGAGLIGRAGASIGPLLQAPRAIIVSDENVAPLYGEAVAGALARAGIEAETVTVPPGEGSKDFAHLERLIDTLLDARIERRTTLIALGGGVIGDLVGFAASIVLRGIDFVQIPTTLLAQVDSAVGGKTGINTRHGKNLVGSFHQPRLVLADTDLLDSLPRREFLAGYAEIVKYGLIGDPEFFTWLETHGPDLIEGDASARVHAVATSCRAKAAIVARDERETGARELLNLGHTFAHALEAETGLGGALRHGEAVAIGMIMAFDLSVTLGLCPTGDAARLARHLAAVGLPTSLDTAGRRWSAPALLRHMAQDKKVRGGRVRFVLARGIGDAFIADDVPEEAVRTLLERAAA